MRPTTAVLATALPALALAVLGSYHPPVLTPESAPWWRDLHVIGLVLFPLLALGPWAVVRAAKPAGVAGKVLEGLVIVLGLVYAVFYGALDALAGIGGGHETMRVGPGPWVAALFEIADALGINGSYAYLAATVLAAVLALVAAPGLWRLLAGVGALFAVVGAWSFLTSHIYWPYGVATMVMLGIGHTAMALAATRRTSPTARRAPAAPGADAPVTRA
ncbi:hypothetical protein EV188_103244 [Actinomycetospora succinea]|uniref:DUF4386 family protein n=1 Tax=Actinomycetospora succinea TaxID=663603 RepID=A0A4R6VDB9_9PSEU|nr:hypothetical protein [Actinomycetospora succinea]TDQ60742.1 hypothetical protein EV188_103244 [Actinomycetospora succinea]